MTVGCTFSHAAAHAFLLQTSFFFIYFHNACEGHLASALHHRVWAQSSVTCLRSFFFCHWFYVSLVTRHSGREGGGSARGDRYVQPCSSSEWRVLLSDGSNSEDCLGRILPSPCRCWAFTAQEPSLNCPFTAAARSLLLRAKGLR